MAEPKCPSCEIEGIEHITSKESAERSLAGKPWVSVIYCNNCGHVYNTVAKHVFVDTQGKPILYVKQS